MSFSLYIARLGSSDPFCKLQYSVTFGQGLLLLRKSDSQLDDLLRLIDADFDEKKTMGKAQLIEVFKEIISSFKRNRHSLCIYMLVKEKDLNNPLIIGSRGISGPRMGVPCGLEGGFGECWLRINPHGKTLAELTFDEVVDARNLEYVEFDFFGKVYIRKSKPKNLSQIKELKQIIDTLSNSKDDQFEIFYA